MRNFNVLMFGSRRAGKSSILASMIDSFETIKSSLENKISVSPDEATKILLQNKKEKLRKIFEDFRDQNNNTPWVLDVAPSSEMVEYKFYMKAEGSEEQYSITFTDVPGEWLMREDERAHLKEILAESQIVMVAIDTPHMIEENGDLSDSVNNLWQIERFLQNIPNEDKTHRLVLFVPVKCEKYYHEGRMNEVNQAIKEQYANTLKTFAKESMKKLYTVAITPILTLGGVVFHDFKRDEEGYVEVTEDMKPIAAYYKIYETDPNFNPRYCEQPLLYLLNFIVENCKIVSKRITKENKPVTQRLLELLFVTILTVFFGWNKKVADAWKNVLSNSNLIESATKIIENVKVDGDGYEMIQNPYEGN